MRRRRTRSGRQFHEYLRTLYRASDRDGAADGRAIVRRARGLPAAADRGAAKRELSDPSGDGTAARRRSAIHGVLGGNAARDAVRPDPRPHPDDLLERAGLHADHAAVRFEPADRWVRIRHAIRHQRGECLSAAQHAVPPTINKVNPADTPILVLAITSDTLPLTTVDAYAENILLQKISQISGVGLVGVAGRQKPAVRIERDPQALAARGLSLEDVRSVVSLANVDLPKGTLNSPRQSYTLNTNDQLLKPDGYNDLILAYRNGSPVRVKDVGKAIDGPENNLIAAWYNKKRAIILPIQRSPGANVIATVDRIKAMMPVLQASIPSDIKIETVSDRTETIRASVADVQFTLVLSVVLVVMVIFLFLRNVWATIIPAVTVPLSLIGTFAVLYELGYSLDNLSLMALTIATGFVVDDAVVVIENTVRHLEEGLSPLEAALKSAGEIGFTIISITLSLLAVFIPLFLMSGYVGA